MAVFHPVFEGSLVALVTPMAADSSIDFKQLELLVEWHIQQQSDGLVVMGTTGESSLMSDQEIVEVVAKVIDIANGRIPVIAGCGGTSTEKTVGLAKNLESLRPAALLCVTPYYVKPEQSGLIEHYRAIADATNVPILLYNVPSRTGCDLINDSVVKLASHSNIIGLKDATAQLDRVRELRKVLPNSFSLLSGDDETAFDYVVSGGSGVISVTANIVPNKMHQWIRLIREGEIKSSKELFAQLMGLHKVLFVESNPIPVKWALHLMGKISTGLRRPLGQASEKSKEMIKSVLLANDLA